jgi:hypothetical protein
MMKQQYLVALIIMISCPSVHAATLQQMTDEELAESTGQALLSLAYLAPGDVGNYESSSNIGFYKLGLEAEVQLNANIKKLQLGCGGANGAGACDIDIDNLSLSGGTATSTNTERASSDAILTNPFVQIAIKNPGSASTREIVGIQLSAEKVVGLLTLGESNSTTPNGINSFSGYMKVGAATGTATTATRSMTYADTNQAITGRINASGILLDFSSTDYNLALSSATATLSTNETVVSGTRINTANLTGSADIGAINFSGSLAASVLSGLATLNKNVTGSITGLKAAVTVEENLGYIHAININNPASLSLQSQTLHWPDTDAAAEKGWWLGFDDTINIGSVSPSAQVSITNAVLQQVVSPISTALYNNPTPCSLINCLVSDLTIGEVKLDGTVLDFPLANLQLSGQTFAPNCYGSLTFC